MAVDHAEHPVHLTERAVVACILRHAGRIALLKRSQAVASAPGRWHCVTGFVDDGVGPLDQALTELDEETGLAGQAVRLVAAPPPLRIERPEQGRIWVIHPFLFETASPELRLDWEHDEYRWIDPSDLATTDCVPWVRTVWASFGEL